MQKLPLALLSLTLLCACAPRTTTAEATLRPTHGNTAAGTMTFAQTGADLLIKGAFTGLTPGAHGLHIHVYGDCSGSAATAAGPHFNPFGKRHGPPGGKSSHLGDLPMLTAGADGTARFEARMDVMTVEEGPTSIAGRSVIITARPDNFTTQPDGASGARISCGVIKLK